MSLGGWTVNVSTNFPQKVATGIAQFDEQIIGAEYNAVAYLGSQVVDGTNHAVLAEQSILTGKDTKNAVVMVFNERPKSTDVTLLSINCIVRGGQEFGGMEVNVTADIPEDAKEAFNKVFDGYVGAKIEPFAYIGKRVTKGVEHFFACEVTPVVANPIKTIQIVKANAMDNSVDFKSLFGSKDNTNLGYAFTW